ncbi:hypothetical protein JHK85_012788 [Glycine max]|nr:hypothetical protein JHK85_012788 [Glycine max]
MVVGGVVEVFGHVWCCVEMFGGAAGRLPWRNELSGQPLSVQLSLLDGLPNQWTSNPRNYRGYDYDSLLVSDQADVEGLKQLTFFTTMFKSSRIIDLEYQSMDLRVHIASTPPPWATTAVVVPVAASRRDACTSGIGEVKRERGQCIKSEKGRSLKINAQSNADPEELERHHRGPLRLHHYSRRPHGGLTSRRHALVASGRCTTLCGGFSYCGVILGARSSRVVSTLMPKCGLVVHEKADQATTIATKAAGGLTTPVTPPLNVVSMMEKTHISKKRAWTKANDETYIQVDFEDLDARSVGSACTDRQSLIKDIWGN